MSFVPEGLRFLAGQVARGKGLRLSNEFFNSSIVLKFNLTAVIVQGFLGGLEDFQHLQALSAVGLGVVAVGKAV